MSRRKSYQVENITILCDERCPLYYCSDPCRVERHVRRHSIYMDEESSFTML